jgi:hypothetical protein
MQVDRLIVSHLRKEINNQDESAQKPRKINSDFGFKIGEKSNYMCYYISSVPH